MWRTRLARVCNRPVPETDSATPSDSLKWDVDVAGDPGNSKVSMRSRFRCWLVSSVLVPAAVTVARGADGPTSDSAAAGWQFRVAPYLWVPRIDGILNFTTSNGTQPVVSLTPINYLDNLNVPLMLAGDVRHGAWGVSTDVVFVDFSGEKAQVTSIGGPGGSVEIPVDTGSKVGLRATIWTLGGCYRAFDERLLTFEVLAGFRYLRVKSTLDYRLAVGGLLPQEGSLEQTDGLWNGVVGLRGRVWLGTHRWFAPYHVDIGTGDSDLTWQALGGIGYAFGWGELILDYRDLGFDSGGEELIERLRLTGPTFGVSFHF